METCSRITVKLKGSRKITKVWEDKTKTCAITNKLFFLVVIWTWHEENKHNFPMEEKIRKYSFVRTLIYFSQRPKYILQKNE